ncbi:hypothetical protein I547_2490 [Mycobacterium kansasii 824]|uniref:Uncharacterized protein n=1 Tax=Mycobacterium kansasii TaxID=1768 RepID=A0A1V3X8E0_MYCKA|nr:hypothetical protein I547_2490 [Mycobacterium kansasii 824]OOK75465.1 hypothetical protein BZL30_4214 [Mycobacterium kansasii]
MSPRSTRVIAAAQDFADGDDGPNVGRWRRSPESAAEQT